MSDMELHRNGECEHGCALCVEATALAAELTRLYISSYNRRDGWQARTAREDRIGEVSDRLRELGAEDAITRAARDAEDADEAARDAYSERS